MSQAKLSERLSGCARLLVQSGLLTDEKAAEISEKARKEHTPFIRWVVEHNLLDGNEVASIQSKGFGVPFFDIATIDPEQLPLDLISGPLVNKHFALPLYRKGNRLFVAIADPTNLHALEEFRFQAGVTTEGVLVEAGKLAKLIDKVLDAKESESLADFDDADLDNLDHAADTGPDDDSDAVTSEDAPVVRFVNKLLLDAIKKGASDLHFEPYEKKFRVRFRTDGILHEVASPPLNLHGRMSARLKVMAGLDISERRIPQDGRIKLKLSKNKAIDFRVSTLPTLFGEKVVMRILDPASAQLGIEALGFEPDQQKLFEERIVRPQGMVLVTGPTGSGKTVTLYTGVNILNTEDRNISTAEDPVEINLQGVNQVNVNPKAGLTFASALRSFLRQDPDIVLVGEIRDLETAEIAIKAAQTGHMVLSTLHTNSAPETLTRLVNMGVAPFNISTTVSLVIAQRLARRLCKHCKRPADLPPEVLINTGFSPEEVENLTVYEPVGCDQCTMGYKGRVGIYQVMPVSEATGRIIMEGGNAIDIADQAKKEGISDLRQSSLEKVRQGVTSLEEINRVTQD